MATGTGEDEHRLAAILESYRHLTMPIQQYLLLVVLPATTLCVLLIGFVILADLPLIPTLATVLLGVLIFGSALAYPKIEMDRRRVSLENQFHLAVTHMTVLSTTNIDRMEVFRTIADEEEYGELAREFRRIVELVDTWNQSLDDACRRRAKQVPSDTIADFFERLAYTLGAGQRLDEFLLEEQSAMVEDYKTVYEGTLENLDVLKDLYLSMVMSMVFALVFAVVLPILTGTNPTLTVMAVLVVFVFVQMGFFAAIRSLVPYDPVWFQAEGYTSAGERRVRLAMVAGVAGTVLLMALLGAVVADIGPARVILPPDLLPRPLYLAVPVTPLILPGLAFYIEEKRIKSRDQEFPSFIRALGGAESAKQSTTTDVLHTLRRKDFGPLTDDINALFRRLNMRIDTKLAWRQFAAEANSYLIQKFSEMYLMAREMGGSPKQLGELISTNMSVVNQLREQRRQAAITLIGVLYGMTAAATFAFFIALEIVRLLAGMDFDIGTSAFDFTQLLHTEAYQIEVIEAMLYLVVLFNAMLSAILVRTTDGGHKGNAYLHFVLLTWIASLTAVLTSRLIGSFLTI